MSLTKDQQVIENLFNKISPQYDRVNKVLSLGIDKLWHLQVTQPFPKKADLEIIDLASGPCDLLIAFLKAGKVKRAVALDIAEEMLLIGKKSLKQNSQMLQWNGAEECP